VNDPAAGAPSPERIVAASDCERVRDGWITQPVNTATSLAYVGAGAWLARRRHDGPLAGAAATALVLNGIGSVAYHGPGGRVGKWAHDVGLNAVTATLAVGGLARLASLDHRREWAADAAVVAVAGTVLAVRPDAEAAVSAPLAVLAVGHELVRPSRRGRGKRLAGGLALGVGAVVHARSRTGGPWCRPDGPFHGHGVWHVLSALGLALLADAAVDERAA
jgi:hypothetical protein